MGAEPAPSQEGPSTGLCTSTAARRALLTDDSPTYSELNDSSFCGVSIGERRLQELLESTWSHYRPISQEQEMPRGSGGQEGGCEQCKQAQGLPKRPWVGENSTPGENGLQQRGELCLQSAASGDRYKASENKPSAPRIAASSEQLMIPHHARHYRSSTSTLQEKAAAKCPSNPARVSAKPGSPEGRARDNGNRRRLAFEGTSGP